MAIKFSNSFAAGPVKASSDFSSEGSALSKSENWALVLILAAMSVTPHLNSEVMRLAFATTPVVILVAVLFGSQYRVQVAIGCLPLLIGLARGFPEDEDSLVRTGLEGGPIGLYFANQLLFGIFSSPSRKKDWLSVYGKLPHIAPLALIAFFYFPSYNMNLDNSGYGFSLDPRPLLIVLYGLAGYSKRSLPILLLALPVLFILSNLGQHDNNLDNHTIFTDVIGHLSFQNLGFIMSLGATALCGAAIRGHQRKPRAIPPHQSAPVKAASPPLTTQEDGMKITDPTPLPQSRRSWPWASVVFLSLIVLMFVNGWQVDIGAPILEFVVFDETVLKNPGDSWPPKYVDQILIQSGNDTKFTQSIGFWATTLIDAKMGIAVCLFTLGYILGGTGIVIASLVWLAVPVWLYTSTAMFSSYEILLAGGPSHEYEWSQGSFGMKFDYWKLNSLLAPKAVLGGAHFEVGPDFVFSAFGAWLGLLLTTGRPETTVGSLTGWRKSLCQPKSPIYVALVGIGVVLIGFFSLRLFYLLIILFFIAVA